MDIAPSLGGASRTWQGWIDASRNVTKLYVGWVYAVVGKVNDFLSGNRYGSWNCSRILALNFTAKHFFQFLKGGVHVLSSEFCCGGNHKSEIFYTCISEFSGVVRCELCTICM